MDERRFSEIVYELGSANRSDSCIIRPDMGPDFWECLGVIKSFPKNHVLLERDRVPDCFYIVKSGTVVGYEELANGNELICYVMEKNAMLLEANVLLERSAPVSFRTMEPSELLCVSRAKLLEGMMMEPKALLSLFCSVSDKFLEAMEELRQAKCRGAEWRLCELLLDFAARYGVAYDGKVLIRKKINIQMKPRSSASTVQPPSAPCAPSATSDSWNTSTASTEFARSSPFAGIRNCSRNK